MDGKTIVLGNSTGGVIHTSKNTEYGYIRVEQERSLFDNKGFLRRKPISALIPGTITDLDIQYLIAMDAGDFTPNPFHDSALNNKIVEKEYDFSYISDDENEINDIISDDLSIDDIIDLNDSLSN